MQKSHLNIPVCCKINKDQGFGSHGKRLIFLSNSNAKFDPKFFAISLVSGNYFIREKVPK
jgi:hypothetical protein